MNLENLIRLEKAGKIKKENFALSYFVNRFSLVSNRIKTANILLKNNNSDESIYISAYSELYSSFRILCEIMLAMSGFRTCSGPGHHESAISTIWLTLEDKEMEPVYLRLKKIGGKRNELEYGSGFDISLIEMESMLKDVQAVLKRVEREIDKKR